MLLFFAHFFSIALQVFPIFLYQTEHYCSHTHEKKAWYFNSIPLSEGNLA